MIIYEYRKIKKISQTDFAKIIGVTPSHINQIEKGTRRPSPGLALKIQEATNGVVKVMELLYPESKVMKLLYPESTAKLSEQPAE